MTEPSEAATAGPDVPGAVLLPGLESVEPGEPAPAPPDAAAIAGALPQLAGPMAGVRRHRGSSALGERLASFLRL